MFRRRKRAATPAELVTALRQLRQAYLVTGDEACLQAVPAAVRLVTARAAPYDREHAEYFAEACAALRAAYTLLHDPQVLADAIDTGRRALKATQPGDPVHRAALVGLAAALLEEFRRTGSTAPLAEAVQCSRDLLAALPAADPELSDLIVGLGRVLLYREGYQGTLFDLDDAIAALQQALVRAAARPSQQARAPRYPRPAPLADQVMVHVTVPQEAGSEAERRLSLLDRVRDSARAASADASLAAGQELSNAAEALLTAYEETGDLDLLIECIEPLRGWLADSGPGAADPLPRFYARHVLGTALWSLFERNGDLAALTEGIGLLEATATADEVPGDLRLKSLANLIGAYTLRFSYGGDPRDADHALAAGRDLLAATDPADPARPSRICGVAGQTRNLALHLGDTTLMAKAVALQRDGIAAYRDAAPPFTHSDLGLYLLGSQQMGGGAALLDEAVEQCRRAVAGTHPRHLLYPRMQANLGTVLLVRSEVAGHLGDHREAVAALRAAVTATPDGHPNIVQRAATLAEALRQHAKASADPVLLDEAARMARAAMDATPEGHQEWGRNRVLMATIQLLRAAQGGTRAQRDEAAALLSEVAASNSVPPTQRVAAAHLLSGPLLSAGDLPATLDALATAITLLPQVAGQNLGRPDRERWLALFEGLASDAAALAIRLGDPGRAVTLLEQGRGILLRQAVSSRADLTVLAAREPDLAAEVERLRDLLDPVSAGPAASGPADAGLSALHRAELAAQWDALLTRVRALPGFGRFLCPPDLDDLLRRCRGGPVLVLNVSKSFGCDALVVSRDGVRAVPLAGLDYAEARQRADTLQAEMRADLDDYNEWAQAALPGAPLPDSRVAALLGWLWDVAARPALDAADVPAPAAAGVPLPRVWWILTGPLAFLPVHAAGRGADSVLDRAVSSYLPVIGSLPDTAPVPRPGALGALAVGIPQTPGWADLPDSEREVTALAARVPGTRTLTGTAATNAAVRAALPYSNWVHFACHGESDATDPANPGLLLYDHAEHGRLTIREIAGLRHHAPELAFLSACDTAHGPASLADEAVNLAGSFHLAGFGHVIGTLWGVDDTIAADVAELVYRQITDPAPDASRAALALHHAMREVRARYPAVPALWASHIHLGA